MREKVTALPPRLKLQKATKLQAELMGSTKKPGAKLSERVLKLSGRFALGVHNITTGFSVGDQDFP